jgi:CRISPR-associated endonuclease/helicase Cas3
MSELEASDFEEFFGELHNDGQRKPLAPLPWQRRLARKVCEGNWPAFIDLPTASGKTACLDIAVFALAVQAALEPAQRTIGRRIFFVVNRRVIVDEAHQRATKIAAGLARAIEESPPNSILRRVAEALRQVSGHSDAPPLDAVVLRGGIVRDNRWTRSITQPTIVTSTIDQVGSRLLFRGYGVSPEAAPIHAALIAHDSTILLDEAHISQPFVETLQAFRRYRGESWATEAIRTGFHFVQLTATPGHVEGDVFRLADEDRRHPVLIARHDRVKPVGLHVAHKVRGNRAMGELATELVAKAIDLQQGQPKTVAIVVNRVATAREVYKRLHDHFQPGERFETSPAEIHLAIGRMRAIDRDELTRAIQSRVSTACAAMAVVNRPLFVVATQCLEVGADFDFDSMVCECASIDALRQRFGRLNRGGREIDARGWIVIRADQTEGDDPIYGPALANTWQWLLSAGSEAIVDFGINALSSQLHGVDISSLMAPRASAPVMFPAYLDAWIQTSPRPTPDPDVSLFLHGPQRSEPDVIVCWRDDLGTDEDLWLETVGLCPPSSPECMPVPIGVVRAWLTQQDRSDVEDSDLLDVFAVGESEEETQQIRRPALVWRGAERSKLLRSTDDLRPGDTIVLPVPADIDGEKAWNVFGHIPADAPKDVADKAYRLSRGRAILRLRPDLIAGWGDSEAVEQLREWLADPNVNLRRREIRDLLKDAADHAPPDSQGVVETLRLLADEKYGLEDDRYPDGKGIVLRTRRRVPPPGSTAIRPTIDDILPAIDDGEDETSRVSRENPIPLAEHLRHVREELDAVISLLPMCKWAAALQCAADLHDWGKADERFQALLINGDRIDAGAQRTLWAKSARMPATREQRRQARDAWCRSAAVRRRGASAGLTSDCGAPRPRAPICPCGP